MLTKSVIVAISLAIVGVYADYPNVTVQTNAGTFIGYRQTVNAVGANAEIDKFLGIPYAEPPVGNLRFRKPVPKASFSEPLVVQSHGDGCIQADIFMSGDPTSEDCLFLNVYAPVRTNASEKLAVMVWIHGGAFVFGSANVYVADLLATEGDVIVVTINYRLFVLGFLNVKGADIDANCGLWDQHLAIKWIHDNIEAFGGDAGRVTVFGESAGAASVIYQGFFPGNEGLFQRLIAESGTSAVSWAFTEKPESEAEYFANVVNCSSTNQRAMVKCLREIPVDVYRQKILEVAFIGFPLFFLPSLDGEFVSTSPYMLLDKSLDIGHKEREMFSSVDLLTGTNTDEGGVVLGPTTGIPGDINTFLPSKDEFENILVPVCVNITFGKRANDMLNDVVWAEYTTWDGPSSSVRTRDEVVNMYTDALYMAPMYQTLNLHTQLSSKKTYMYHFIATPTSHVFPAASWLDTAVHGDEMLFIFGEVAELNKFGHSGQMEGWEKTLAKGMMKLWTNFAKTGNMNQPHDLGLNWEPYTEEQHQYIEIVDNLTESVVKENLNGKRVNVWNEILPRLVKTEGESRPCENETSGVSAFTRASVLSSNVLFVFLLYIFVL